MIRKDQMALTVLKYTDEVDKYGQMRQGTATRVNILGTVYLYQNNIVENPKYNDVEYLVLTKSTDVEEGDVIMYEGATYDVKFIIPSRRYNQLFLKKK